MSLSVAHLPQPATTAGLNVSGPEARALIVATLAHIALIAALSIGWAWAAKPLPPADEITPVEFVDIADAPRVTRPPEPSIEAAPQETTAPPEAPPESQPVPAPTPEALPAPDAKPEPEPKAQAKPAPAPKKPVAKPLDTQTLSNLINKALPKAKIKSLNTSDLAKTIEAAQPKNAAIDPRAAATLAQAIRAQVAPCWNPPIGGADVRRMTVLIGAEYRADGSVTSSPRVISQTGVSGQNKDYARAFAETARRAVLRCSPLKLPADLYPLWKSVEINFDPEQMT